MKDQAGFTLLETLVAFAVLALCLGVALNIFGQGAHAAATGHAYTTAAWIAESQLAQAVAHSSTTLRGRTGDYVWNVRITPYLDTDTQHSHAQLPLEQVHVQVQWHERSLEVQSLRWAAH